MFFLQCRFLRISDISVYDFSIQVCKSYPATVVVPKSIPDEDIIVASSFRQGGRFPILCYRHENGTVLLRSGQPLVGPAGRRCKEDERLINAVLGPGKRGYIIDTRTQTLAQTAKVEQLMYIKHFLFFRASFAVAF